MRQEICYIFHFVSAFPSAIASSWEARNKLQLVINDHAPKNRGSMPAIHKRSPRPEQHSVSQSVVLLSDGSVSPVTQYLHFLRKWRIRMLPVRSHSHTVRPHFNTTFRNLRTASQAHGILPTAVVPVVQKGAEGLGIQLKCLRE